jgi:hypothetical protein
VNGRASTWFRATQVRHEGRIRAGSVNQDMTFLEADLNLNDEIDTAYRSKYHRYAAHIVNSIVSPKARSATIKLEPR